MKFKQFYLVEDLTKDFVVCYAGRFQPMHINHYESYKELVGLFGKDKVYIVTSDKVDPPKSPFSFDEKKKIMVEMYGIPEDKIVLTVNPYKPVEVFSKLSSDDIAYIAALGNKDKERLEGKYFVPYAHDQMFDPYKKHGYIYVVSPKESTFDGNIIDGTLVRTVFKSGDEDRKTRLFNSIYPKYNKEVYDLIDKKINNS